MVNSIINKVAAEVNMNEEEGFKKLEELINKQKGFEEYKLNTARFNEIIGIAQLVTGTSTMSAIVERLEHNQGQKAEFLNQLNMMASVKRASRTKK